MGIKVIDHPLIMHKLTLLRDKNTSTKNFRELLDEIGMLMGYEATRGLPLEEVEIETPLAVCRAKVLTGKKLAIVPILRAGLAMVNGLVRLIPAAKIGHIGVYRDPLTFEPHEYFCKLPSDIADRYVIVVDPMLATGGSAVAALDLLKARGARTINLMCLVAAPQGIAAVEEHHPDVDIYVAAVDSHLDEHAYIVPGLGDAGDRVFGTK
ncbi:MAG: uracil phosphoribosyltransferase [Negativicutes bacterium]|nr:uracil phosphoribosyltransferase [Negativicutes bacterium]